MFTTFQTSSNLPRLFLLDGMALAYRAYFSFISRPLTNSKGENTSAIFGFTNTLIKILEEEKPEYIAVVFDTKEPTFRHKEYTPYKATREKMPDDMASQLEQLKEVVQAFNVPSLELPGYEADDIMGTLAKQAEAKGILTYLVTSDKDFMQLISPLVKIFKPGKSGDEWEIVDETGVMQKFGVEPEKVIEVLGLIGDSSDNVPGVPGIGEKTAIPLIREYGTIENLLENVEKISAKGVREKLKNNRELALLSKRLVTIETKVPIEASIKDLKTQPHDNQKLIKLLSGLEFKSLLRKLSNLSIQVQEDVSFDVAELEQATIETDEHVHHIIKTEKELAQLLSVLSKSKLFVFDTETTSTDALKAELVGMSFSVKAREAYYVPVQLQVKSEKLQVDNVGFGLFEQSENQSKISPAAGGQDNPQSVITEGLPADLVLNKLSPIFQNPKIKKVGQNIKYDVLVLASHGVNVEGIEFDTMVANYVLRPDGQHNMDDMATEHLRYKTISYDDLVGTGKDRKELWEIESEKVATYSAEDADITFRLYETLQQKLEKQNLLQLCEEVEFPLVPVLTDMELAGVKLDTQFLSDLSKELERMLENLTRDIYHDAGEKFNINSTQQLGKILFDKLKLPPVKKTKTGYSTDVAVLETLRHQHAIIEKLLEQRQLQKLKSTYVDALPTLINPKTGRVHTSFNQTIAATGRLSSSDPNIQNIPIRTEIGRSIRKAFIPGKPDWLIISADYSQIELRVMAHVSGDEGLKDAFNNHEDIHATTAAKVFGVNLSDVTRDMRRKAKEVNFGIMYGIGAFGLANRLDIAQSEAKEIIAKYFERFPNVRQYIDATIAQARQTGYVSTLLGRRRFFPDINNKNQSIRGNAERQAINMPIQGTAADMIKLAMIRIHKMIIDSGLKIQMLLQVHDELVFESSKNDVEAGKKLIIQGMKEALPLSVPVEVEINAGRNWFEAH
ncbi:MAG: DNA polymerase I [Ignavibacteriae bacterium]|nr:DNA polymerase I [Ignavibacteriota bacterium]